jgi:hypothetical protein
MKSVTKMVLAAVAVASVGLFAYVGNTADVGSSTNDTNMNEPNVPNMMADWLTKLGVLNAPDCPAQGSGVAGVEQWTEDNCSDDECVDDDGECHDVETCNGDFVVSFDGVVTSGSFRKYTYTVCRSGSRRALSHMSLGLGHIDCLGEGISLGDLIVPADDANFDDGGCKINGVLVACSIQEDPTTGVLGVKIDVPAGNWEVDGCLTMTYTLDKTKLASGYTLGIGCTTVATKAGNQDIRASNRPTPGYACACGPVCELQQDCDDETAYAFSGDQDDCFINYGFSQWGWTIPIEEEGEYTYEFWAGAGQCNLNAGTHVGWVTVNYGGGTVTVDFDICPDNELGTTHVYAGYDPFPTNQSGNETVAPGQYTIGEDLEGPIYVIVHAEVFTCNDCTE